MHLSKRTFKRILYFQIISYHMSIFLTLGALDVIRFWIKSNVSIKAKPIDTILTVVSIILASINVLPLSMLFIGFRKKTPKTLQSYIKSQYLMYSITFFLNGYKEYRYELENSVFKAAGCLPRILLVMTTILFMTGVPLVLHFVFVFKFTHPLEDEIEVEETIRKHGVFPCFNLKKLLYLELMLAPLYPLGTLRLVGKLTGGVTAEKFRTDVPYLISNAGFLVALFSLWFGLPLFYQGIKHNNAQKLTYWLIIKVTSIVFAGICFTFIAEIEENISQEHELLFARIFPWFHTIWATTEICLIISMIHQIKAKLQVHTQMEFLKIPKSLKILSSKLKVGMKSCDCIGQGQFGKVWKGHLISQRFPKIIKIPIALKIIDFDLSEEEFRTSVGSEIMAYVNAGSHPNLVNFFGYVRDQKSKNLGLVLEMCEFGNLKSWFNNKRDGQSFGVSINLLNKWSKEMAIGLEYLSSKKIIHGDLALRNILLDGNHVAKISDFGFSLRLYNYQKYAISSMKIFPWRSMAPECLTDLKFSTASDVWSYGVLLFELYTFGRTPWSGLDWTSDFVARLKKGTRLQKPEKAPETLYKEIMLKCWTIDAAERLQFGQIVEIISNKLNVF